MKTEQVVDKSFRDSLVEKLEDRFEAIYTKTRNLTKSGNLTKSEVFFHLDVEDRKVCTISFWDSQVCNGGVSQWIGNGYQETGSYLREALKSLPVTDEVQIVMDLVDKAGHLEKEPDNEEDYESWHEITDKLDDAYYKINEEFIYQVASHFCPQ